MKSLVARVAFGAWMLSASVASAYMMAGHLLTLPKPELSASEKAIAALRTAPDSDRWMVVHVLSAECRCSTRVLEHLQATDRPDGVVEKIVLVDATADQAAQITKFAVERVEADALSARFGIDGAPLMLVADPTGKIRYSGGYTDRKQGPTIFDREIIASVQNDHPVDSLPLFGCAVSQKLRSALNPLTALAN